MTPKQKRRMYGVGLVFLGVAVAVSLILTAFDDNILLFHTPSEVAEGTVELDKKFRIGGMVVPESVQRAGDSLKVSFAVTDTAQQVTVEYEGLLPDLFREGQGIVAQGRLREGNIMVADEVLAKHDENYMPPEVADALEAAGADPRMKNLETGKF